MKIAFIGPGRMGRPMLDRLLAAGHDATVLVRLSSDVVADKVLHRAAAPGRAS